MNRCGKIAICLLGGLALSSGVRADDAVLPGDPYAIVVARNIFGLNPPPPVDPNAQIATPPVKITPNGIISIFGKLQALYKVAGTPKPGGPPPVDQSYILSEGQREDDIEVVKIDEKNSMVTFNNHGETQTLPLVTTLPSSTPSTAPAGPGGGPGVGAPGGRYNPGSFNPGGASGGRSKVGVGGGTGASSVGSDNGGNASDGSNLRSVPTRNNTFNAASQIPEGMTPEVQTIAIEANRELTKQQVLNGDLPPLPITDLTPQPDPASPQ